MSVAQYCIRFSLNLSSTGRNVLFCSRHNGFMASFQNNTRYTINTVRSSVQSKITDTERDVVDFLYECVLIRETVWLCCLVGFYRAALNAGQSSPEKGARRSVCLSVRLSNVWIVTKRNKNLSRFYTIRKII